MKVNSLLEIDINIFIDVVDEVKELPITSKAPLGYSSDTILIYGDDCDSRRSGVSIRNHSGLVSLLITDADGRFLFNGGLSKNMKTHEIALTFWDIFLRTSNYMKS